jgi:hypothetical protein
LFKQLQLTNFHCQWHNTPPITSNRTWTRDLILHKGQPLLFYTTRSHSPSPFNSHVHIILKKVNIPFSDLWDLLWGVKKLKKLAEIFVVDARILYVLMVKISDFFDLFWNLCAISKVALVVFLWLIFKLDFDLDDDLIWI